MTWVPRDQNAEANAITNVDLNWLCPERRISTSMQRLPFKILMTLRDKGEKFCEGLENINEQAAPLEDMDVRNLRVRDPWE